MMCRWYKHSVLGAGERSIRSGVWDVELEGFGYRWVRVRQT